MGNSNNPVITPEKLKRLSSALPSILKSNKTLLSDFLIIELGIKNKTVTFVSDCSFEKDAIFLHQHLYLC